VPSYTNSTTHSGRERKRKLPQNSCKAQFNGCSERGSACHLLLVGYLLGSFHSEDGAVCSSKILVTIRRLGLLHSEDGCSMFLQNIGNNQKAKSKFFSAVEL
jgi:hypothetical protein